MSTACLKMFSKIHTHRYEMSSKSCYSILVKSFFKRNSICYRNNIYITREDYLNERSN